MTGVSPEAPRGLEIEHVATVTPDGGPRIDQVGSGTVLRLPLDPDDETIEE